MKLSNSTFDVLKWVAIIVCPALATFIVAMGQIWGLPYAAEIAATITALATFLGAILGISSANYSGESEEE